MYLTTWLAAIVVAALAALTIAIALPNTPDEELNRASAAQAIVVSFIVREAH
jgi:hypothetical protein